MNKVAVIGMAGNSAFLSVDHFHAEGETVAAKAIHFEPGGKGFNQAVAAARHGAQVAFLCAVGREFRQEIEAFLRNDGILPVLCPKEDATAFASILTDAQGANQVTVYQGARLEEADVDRFALSIAEADVLLLNNEVPAVVNERAIALAKEHGAFVILNPAPAMAAVPSGVDLFTPNEQESAPLAGRENMVVTLGERGCRICATGEVVPALRVDTVVDTTGAGDTFNGVLAAHLAAGEALRNGVEAAIRAAGVSVTRKYAATAIPTAEEVEAFCMDKGDNRR